MRLIVAAMVVVCLASIAGAATISGRIVDHKGNPIVGIPVSFQGVEDLTTEDGTFFINGVTSTKPSTWGGIKAMYKDENLEEKMDNSGGLDRSLTQTCVDTLKINCGSCRNPDYWSAKCVREVSGDFVFNGALPSYIITIPNGPDLSGPVDVYVSPDDFKDAWDIYPNGIGYPQFYSWHPNDLPIITFCDYESAEDPYAFRDVWNACVETMNKWEQMTGINFYNPQVYGYIPEGYPDNGMWIAVREGLPSTNTYREGEWLQQAFVDINTTDHDIINHELGYRALTDNGGCHVTTWDPSNFRLDPDYIQPKDIDVVVVSYDLKNRYIQGENDIKDVEYTN